MAEFGMPFDMPQNPENPEDYLFSAAEERMRIGAEMTDGIFPEIRLITTDATAPEQVIGNSLVVTAGEGLNVVLGKGTALCGSTFYFNTESKTIPVEAGTNDIVVELNLANSNISVINQPRTTGNIEDSLIRTASRWQIALATVTVPEGSECVDFSMITDHRLNTTACSSPDGRPVCGLVGSALQLSSQMFLDEWEYIKGKLAEDPAVSLQFQIGDLNNLKTKNKSNHVAAINEVANRHIEYDSEIIFEGSASSLRTAWPCTITGQANTIIPANTLVKSSGEYSYYIWQDITIDSSGIGTGFLVSNKVTSGSHNFDFILNEHTYNLVAYDSNKQQQCPELLHPLSDYDFLVILSSYSSRWCFGATHPVKQMMAQLNEKGYCTVYMQGYNSSSVDSVNFQRNITSNNYAIGYSGWFKVYGIKTRITN